MKRKEQLRLLFIAASKIDVERGLWNAVRQVAAKDASQASTLLPVYLLLPSFVYGFFDPFLDAPATLKVSYLLLLMPGLISLFSVNTRFFSTGIQRIKLIALTLVPFYVLLALSAIYPSKYLLQIQTPVRIQSFDLRISFAFLIGVVASFTTIGVLETLVILAEESGRSPARWLMIARKHFFAFYLGAYSIFSVLYLGATSFLGLPESLEIVGGAISTGVLLDVIDKWLSK